MMSHTTMISSMVPGQLACLQTGMVGIAGIIRSVESLRAIGVFSRTISM